ncbi:hypothetical protein CRG98_021604 [Punica granatum]|uniref:Uncharacterized protein n=1 Tax=Punica granatum TaxID=22663 RepID=A0A2I0JP10_PUNGR|nr:hypothetical protein CRG98_021604 [Punica granatum]
MDKAGDAASRATGTIINQDMAQNGMDEAGDAASRATGTINSAASAAKETVSDRAKSTYEAAKEAASEATGKLGSEMRKETAEL